MAKNISDDLLKKLACLIIDQAIIEDGELRCAGEICPTDLYGVLKDEMSIEELEDLTRGYWND